MSIWSSAPGEDCHAAEIGDRATNIYNGTGPQTVRVDIATATSWHDCFRLAAWSVNSGNVTVDLDLLIDRSNLEHLRDQIVTALGAKAAEDSRIRKA